MPNQVVLFLGAGASAPFGIPTNKRFVIAFEQELNKTGNATEIKLFGMIKEFLRRNYRPDDDLENLLTIIENLSNRPTFRKLGSTSLFYVERYYPHLKTRWGKVKMPLTSKTQREIDSKTAAGLKEKLKDFVWKKCSEPNIEDIPRIYDQFFEKLADGLKVHTPIQHNGGEVKFEPCDVFTTNYDLSFEIYCKSRGIIFNKGISLDPVTNIPILSSSQLSKDEMVRLFKSTVHSFVA